LRITGTPPYDLPTSSASNTSLPEAWLASMVMRTCPIRARCEARSSRSAISALTRPSLRVRRALTP
jgi:hypothetical protein